MSLSKKRFLLLHCHESNHLQSHPEKFLRNVFLKWAEIMSVVYLQNKLLVLLRWTCRAVSWWLEAHISDILPNGKGIIVYIANNMARFAERSVVDIEFHQLFRFFEELWKKRYLHQSITSQCCKPWNNRLVFWQSNRFNCLTEHDRIDSFSYRPMSLSIWVT